MLLFHQLQPAGFMPLYVAISPVATCWVYAWRCHCTLLYHQLPSCTSSHSFVPAFFLHFLFQSSCFHAQVFGRTLVYEVHIFCGHFEWNLLFSDFWDRLCFVWPGWGATKLKTIIIIYIIKRAVFLCPSVTPFSNYVGKIYPEMRLKQSKILWS